MDGRTAVVAIVIGLGGLGGLGAVAGLGGCALPRDMVEAVDQVTAHPGSFHHSQQLTADLFGLEAAGFERFEVYFLGLPDDPDIVVLDPLEDGYRFDARGWQSAQGGLAVEVVANALARTESAEALLGYDVVGRVVTLGIAPSRNARRPAIRPASGSTPSATTALASIASAKASSTKSRPPSTPRAAEGCSKLLLGRADCGQKE
ncbi:MAG: hypothetical protein QGH01_08405 [Alphaproteobacteria bacterium]|jgi:hypothetical protein|nr:hypothetical protein [Alphaproteobacteria bacterium]